MNEVLKLYERIVNPILLTRRINITACNVVDESFVEKKPKGEQLDLFTNYEEVEANKEKQFEEEKQERKVQKTLLEIKKKYGKNAILKGMNYQEGATAKDRNEEVGGHKG